MKCGEIWLVDFEPQIGSEIKKTRPAVIIDSDYLASEHLRFIIPLTTWQDKFEKYFWYFKLIANEKNNLDSNSAFNARQARYASSQRFIKKIGDIETKIILDLQKTLIKLINPELYKKLL